MRVYSPSFEHMYTITGFVRMQELRRYTGTGSLVLVFSRGDTAAHFLRRNGFIVVNTEPYIIKLVTQTDTEVTVTAYSGHKLLEQLLTGGGADKVLTVSRTGSADDVVKHFIDQSNTDLPIATAPVHAGPSVTDQTRLKVLGDEIVRVLAGAGRGERFTLDADARVLVFDTYEGTDRSRGNAQSNPPVVFTLEQGNIDGLTYTEDATTEQTVIYVGGAGEGDAREIEVVGAASGLDRVERFRDARDVEAGNVALLRDRGAQLLQGTLYAVSVTAQGGGGLVYGVDYELGDVVTTLVPVAGYAQQGDYFNPVETVEAVNQRITEVLTTREGAAETVDLRFGEQEISRVTTSAAAVQQRVQQLEAAEPVPAALGGWRFYSTPEELGLPAPSSLHDICAAMPDNSMAVLQESQITDNPVDGFGTVVVTRRNAYRVAIQWQRGGGYSTAVAGYVWFTNWRQDVGLQPWQRMTVEPTLLWSGAWSGGRITVPGLGVYREFWITMSGQGTTMTAMKNPENQFVRGIGGYSSATPTRITYHFAAAIDGDHLDFVGCSSIQHVTSLGHNAGESMTVNRIYGVG